MKFTLKDYQNEAVRDVLRHLRKARKDWREDYKSAFSLTAATGAGKTVMAAAALEALFYGHEEFDFEADPGAVVIWFSDDPSLNEQSKHRLEEASDKLGGHLITVKPEFSSEKFHRNKVYFLNTQKLSKNSSLVRGAFIDSIPLPGMESDQPRLPMPDGRQYAIWDTIRNTIEDPELTLYLMLDEAHRGTKETSGRQTIVRQLINGQGSVPGIPVVWGISATVERFERAIREMQGERTLFSQIVVDSAKVQESGLLKDTINLDVPDEEGSAFDTVLVRRATDKLEELSEAWSAYAREQGSAEAVQPLMVLQVPNTPNSKDVATYLETVFKRWPDLPRDCVANVFGEHRTEKFGHYEVPYVEPERVHERNWIRILLAKDAISTGWDCPRAEVMVSLRVAKDKTHITQLLGRMIRSPLARRISGNDRLNSVDCLLPFFKRDNVEQVVKLLQGGGESGEEMPNRRVLVNSREMKPNPALAQDVWEKLAELPSELPPKKDAKPIKRLMSLAHELAFDKLRPNAGDEATRCLHKELDGLIARFDAEIAAHRQDVMEVEGTTRITNVHTKKFSFDEFVERADAAVIDEAYKKAARVISAALANSYVKYLAKKQASDHDDEIDGLAEARVTIASIGLVPEIKDRLEKAADEMTDQWLDQYRVEIKTLPDERRQAYEDIKRESRDVTETEIMRPKSQLQQSTAYRETDGTETPVPHFDRHLLCDESGLFPVVANEWELKVIEREISRTNCIAWYRNPAQGGESLRVAYLADKAVKMNRPDFIFFGRDDDSGKVFADILDPHSTHLSDALAKLQGLARYAAKHGQLFRRIDAIAVVDDKYRVLDMQRESVRQAVLAGNSAKSLYQGDAAQAY